MSKIDKTYHELLQHILDKGFKYEDPNRKGIYRIQIPHFQIKHNFKNGFPAITTKKLYWKGVVGELLWFLRGDTNIKYLLDNNINIWNKDAYNYYLKNGERPIKGLKLNDFKYNVEKGRNPSLGDLGRVYGSQWRNWTDGYAQHSGTEESIDQFSNLIKGLKENPMGTKHIVTAWNPAELNDMALPPCHWSFEILVEPNENLKKGQSFSGGILDFSKTPSYTETWRAPKYDFTLKWHQRSVDTFLGLPFNIASYALLAQIIGKMTNMIPKGIIGDLSNVHIYEPHLDAVKEQLSRDVDKYNKCELKIDSHTIHDLEATQLKHIDNNNIIIQNFNLEGYKSYPAIKAEMLTYSN